MKKTTKLPKKDPKAKPQKQLKLTPFISNPNPNPNLDPNPNPKAEKNTQKLGSGSHPSSQKHIFISSWNVNGIRAQLKREDLKNYVEKYKPDIFCMNETKIDEEMFKSSSVTNDMPFMKDYTGFWNFVKPPKKGYSGVALFSKIKPISVQYDLNIEKHDQEGRLITAEYEHFYVCSVYVPNAGQGLKRLDYRTKEWDSDFQEHLNKLKEKKHVILTGDLNVAHYEIDLANPKTNLKTAGFTIEERQSFTKFIENGWIDSFRKLHPTKIKYSYFSMRTGGRAKNVGWRLDYCVVNEDFFDQIISSDINNEIYGSDHTPVELIVQNKNFTSQENQNQNQSEKQEDVQILN